MLKKLRSHNFPDCQEDGQQRNAHVADGLTVASRIRSSCFISLLFLLPALSTSQAAVISVPKRISVLANGTELDASSSQVAVSGNGRYVVFFSRARNLLPGLPVGPALPTCQNPGVPAQVYLFDRHTAQFERISANAQGEPQKLPIFSFNGPFCDATGRPTNAEISSDGRYVSFVTLADNLLPGDTNQAADIYRYDRHARQMARVSLGNLGQQVGSGTGFESVDGNHRRYVFRCDTLLREDPSVDIDDNCIKDMQTGVLSAFRPGGTGVPREVGELKLSADGRFVAYTTTDRSLGIRENFSNGERVFFSIKSNGAQLNLRSHAISPTGNRIVMTNGLRDFYPEAPEQLQGIAIWREETGFAEDASVVDQLIGSFGGYQEFSFDQSGERFLFRQRSHFNIAPSSSGQQLVLRDLRESQGHRIVSTLSNPLTQIGHCDVPFRTNFEQAVEFPNCPRLSRDGSTIVFSSQDGNLVAGDTNFGIPDDQRDARKLDVFVVTLSDPVGVPLPVDSLSNYASFALASLLLIVGSGAMRRLS